MGKFFEWVAEKLVIESDGRCVNFAGCSTLVGFSTKRDKTEATCR